MKDLLKVTGIIVIAIIGLVMFACGDGDKGGIVDPCAGGHNWSEWSEA